MSTSGATLVEDVAKERGGAPQWFQLYMQPDREATGALLDRCVKAGFTALVLTVDQPVPGWSPRAARTPVIASPDIRSVNMVGQPIASTAYDPDRKGLAMFPTNFNDLEWLVKRCAMPVVVKGVLRGDDARRCVDCGVKGIMVSNHGGRHLDTTVTTAEVITEIVGSGRQHRRGLCRRRHPARHRHRQGAGARRARRAARAAAAVGAERCRRRRRAGGDGASARRDDACHAALRRGQPCGADAGSGEAMSELIPTGTLRVGVAFAPSPSPLFVVKDADGAPRGVTVDLGNALANELGVPIELMVAPNTGELVDALEAGAIDVSFMPVDEERKKRIDFGPVYFLVESTYMVTDGLGHPNGGRG